jgi:hypothetical protein
LNNNANETRMWKGDCLGVWGRSLRGRGAERDTGGEKDWHIYMYTQRQVMKPTEYWRQSEERGKRAIYRRGWTCSRYTIHMYGIIIINPLLLLIYVN